VCGWQVKLCVIPWLTRAISERFSDVFIIRRYTNRYFMLVYFKQNQGHTYVTSLSLSIPSVPFVCFCGFLLGLLIKITKYIITNTMASAKYDLSDETNDFTH